MQYTPSQNIPKNDPDFITLQRRYWLNKDQKDMNAWDVH